MKWYFASNDKSEDFFPLIKAAVNSALENTTLEPHFLYDGEDNELTQWLVGKGVKIIKHRVSFYEKLKTYYPNDSIKIPSGAFLRCDIPIIEIEDDFVLYTDCDVLFLREFDAKLQPKYFACSTQFNKWNFRDFNTGVMIMNVKKLRESHQKFIEFIVKNLSELKAFDQTAYQIFYEGGNTKLPTKYNHKPYWKMDKNAVILHFHGSKPTTFTKKENIETLLYVHTKLYNKNPENYDYYLELFKQFCPEIQYDYESIAKLKSGEYPLEERGKTSLLKRIKIKLKKISLSVKK